jgi:AcrR family transcriptional regulator
VAENVGVSEKTVYNYFPTKESLVLDAADETIERVAQALRERRPNESLTDAVVRALKKDGERFAEAPDELVAWIPKFGEMIDSTPALRAAWLEVHDRLATVARDELAALAEVDPSDPEPMVAGRALAGLADVAFESRNRHVREGLRGQALDDAVAADLDRAARLLETGLWSFSLLARGSRAKTQALEAAKAADEARAQVLKALRQARTAWRDLRNQRGGPPLGR